MEGGRGEEDKGGRGGQGRKEGRVGGEIAVWGTSINKPIWVSPFPGASVGVCLLAAVWPGAPSVSIVSR